MEPSARTSVTSSRAAAQREGVSRTKREGFNQSCGGRLVMEDESSRMRQGARRADQARRPQPSRGVLASEEAARHAINAGGLTDDEVEEYLVRGNLQWFFFKRWAALLGLVGGVLWLSRALTLTWATSAVILVSVLVLYILAGVWAAREFKRYDWIDDGGSYRRIEKK